MKRYRDLLYRLRGAHPVLAFGGGRRPSAVTKHGQALSQCQKACHCSKGNVLIYQVTNIFKGCIKHNLLVCLDFTLKGISDKVLSIL